MAEIRQQGLAKRIQGRIHTLAKDGSISPEERQLYEDMKTLETSHLLLFFPLFFSEVAHQVKLGNHVIIEKWLSIFSKPINRSVCEMPKTKGSPRSNIFARRLRFRALDSMKQLSETMLTEEEYYKLTTKKE